MTNQQLLDDAKAAAFNVHVYEGEYAHHKTEYTFDENGLAKFAELILARAHN